MPNNPPKPPKESLRRDLLEAYRSIRELNARLQRVTDAQEDAELLSSKTQALVRLLLSARRTQMQIIRLLQRWMRSRANQCGTGAPACRHESAPQCGTGAPACQHESAPQCGTGAPACQCDAQVWKQDAARFASEALQLDLFPHQARFCDSPKRINLLIAGRGAGKSEAARVKILQDACLRKDHLSLVVSSSQRMSAEFGSRLLDLLRDSPALHSMIANVRADRIALTNGSEIRLLPANPSTIRGFHPRRRGKERGVTLVLDEACFMPNGDEVRKAVEYVLITAKQGRLFIVSSPTSVESWVYGFASQSNTVNSEVAVFQCGSAANPLIPPEEIERLRASKNELEFRAEVLGEWVEGAYGLFSGLIEPNRITVLEPPPPGTIFGLGADLALSFSPTHDRNALAVAALMPPSTPEGEPIFRLLEVRILDCASDRELRDAISQLMRTYPLTRAVVEQYQGKSLAEHCESLGIETELLSPTASRQRVAFHQMHQVLRERRLQLPEALPEAFFTEMKAFQYRRGPDGGVTFGHPSSGGAHDDSVYAAAWALQAAQSARHPGEESRLRIPPVWC